MTRTAFGIDLGGTNLRVCLLDETGRRLAESFTALPVGASGDALMTLLADRIQLMRASAAVQPVGIGIGLAGLLDDNRRLVAGMTNSPALAGRAVDAELEKITGLSCRVANDARVAMLGEARFGAAVGIDNVLMLTLGTGIGGGLLLDGRVRAGPHRFAGEIGLSLVPAATRSGWQPLEDVASPGGLRRTHGLDTAVLAKRAEAGDAAAKAALDEVAERLAVAIVNAHATLDLELIVLAGGLAQAGPNFRDSVRSAFHRLCPPAFAAALAVELGELGAWAGATGAACLWLTAARPTMELS